MGRKICPPALASGDEATSAPGWSSATGGRYHVPRTRGRRTGARAAPATRVSWPPMSIDTDLTRAVRSAVAAGAGSEDFAAIPVPGAYVGAYLRAEDAETIGKLPRAEKRPSLALRVGEVPTPELAPDEVLIATFASSVNYNTVWSAIFEPVPTFAFLKRLAKTPG